MCVKLELFSNKKGVESVTKKSPVLGRRKVWNLEHRFHCVVAGTCFTLGEMHRFCRKGQVKTTGPVTDYELHTRFVGILSDPYAARPAAKYLDRKFKTIIKYFDRASNSQQLRLLWNDAVSNGDVAAALWAVITHPLTSESLLFDVYGEVHMLSHLSGASVRIDMQELTQFRKRVPRLEQELARTRNLMVGRVREKDDIINVLNKRIAELVRTEENYHVMEKKLNALETGGELRHLRLTVETYACKFKVLNQRSEKSEEYAVKQKGIAEDYRVKSAYSQSKMLSLSAEKSALETALEKALSIPQSMCKKNESCPEKVDLAGRSILYVGGRNKMCSHFRALVEQQNGRFIHHDGGREESTQRLDALLAKVDAVLCPMDCVSHDAMHRIKRDCKRYGKHLTVLSQSSLSAFAKGVHEFSKVSFSTQ